MPPARVGTLLLSIVIIKKVNFYYRDRLGLEHENGYTPGGPKIAIGCYESMCNPIARAMMMNAAQTHFNVLLGPCVGHDSLVFKYSEAPCTVLAAKDRVFGHNPLAAVYTLESYDRYLKQPLE